MAKTTTTKTTTKKAEVTVEAKPVKKVEAKPIKAEAKNAKTV